MVCLMDIRKDSFMETPAINSATLPTPSKQDDRISRVAKEFESIFSSMMIKAMRKTIGENPLLPTSMGEKIYTGMLDDEYARVIGEEGTLGLSSLVEKELRQMDSEISVPTITPSWMYDAHSMGRPSSTTTTSDEMEFIALKTVRWNTQIDEAAKKYDMDSSLIAAVIGRESGGNRHAVSRAGAKGLMQLMDGTAKELGVYSPFDPNQNVDGGARYLRKLLNKYDGNEQLALAAYNAGPGAVDKYKGVPPYRETQEYVKSVMALRNHIQKTPEQTVSKE